MVCACCGGVSRTLDQASLAAKRWNGEGIAMGTATATFGLAA
jgi:hypothetical protein